MNLSKKDIHLLKLLRDLQPAFGLQLVRASTMLKRGLIYIQLRRLEDEAGLVESFPSGAGGRRQYRLTPDGEKVLTVLEEEGR